MSQAQIDTETRQRLRCNLFGSVGELSDLEHQNSTWLDPEMQNPHFTFVEFVECFYDAAVGDYHATDPASADAPLSYLLASDALSVRERDLIWPLHLALSGYDEPGDAYDHRTILNDPKWHEVCLTASIVRDGLLGLGLAAVEKACFQNNLPSAAAKRWP